MANPKCLDTSEPSSEFPAEQRTCTRCLKDKSADRSLVLDLDNCSCGESGLAKYIGRRGGSGRMGSSLDGVEASLADRSWNLLEATMEEDTMKGWNFNTEFVASLDNCRVQQKVAAREKRVVALLKAFDEKFDMKDTVATTPVRWTEVDIQFLDLQQRREEQELAQIQEDVRRCNKPRKEEDAVLTSEDERKIIHRAQVDSYLPKINEEDEEQLGARKIAIWHPEVRCQPETLSHLSPEDKGLQDATCQAVNPFHKAVSNEENARSGAWRPEFALPANTGLVALNGATVAPFVAAGTNNIMNKGPTAQCPLARTESICLPADNERLKCTIGNSMCDDDSVYTQSESSLDASDDGSGGTNEGSVLDQSRFLEPFLDTARHALVNKLMQEVWAIFDKAWTAKYTTCGGSVPPSSSPSKERTSTSEGSSIQKRQRQEDDDGNSSGRNNGRRPKRSPPDQRPPDGDERHLELSCPFRKHDPRKYRFPEYKTCARSSWDSVGRVKEHIYRCHRVPIHCTRCWMLFDSQDLLTSHLREEMEAERCDVKPKRALDGITPETELLLKRRKKDYKGQSEPELWKKMYRILFPDEIVPSPYFEAFLDESADQLDLQDRTDYDAFCRRELPRLVRSHLVSAAASQLQALEFALQTQLDEIIEKCLEQLSASYEALRTIDTAPNEAENALPAIIPTGSVDPPTPMEVQHGREYSDEADNIREIQYTSDYFTKVSQYPNQSPAPAGSAMHDLYGQPDDLLTRVLSFKDTENLALYLNAARGCLCPVDACSCPRPRELRQEEGHCLPPAAFQFKARAKILERAPVLEDWNPDEFLVGPGSETDEINLN